MMEPVRILVWNLDRLHGGKKCAKRGKAAAERKGEEERRKRAAKNEASLEECLYYSCGSARHS